eukprot:TRINITY_DN6226_c0_g1_i1.p1 TRINITY_DN6226_c0_g1~~TRINITY_DN6226_c0_g1_i1.p1  ORF type:complete len:347 (-),score=71.72 TRINITY_DN6226_c0_g1_i1:88-1128(-)
MTTTRLRFVNPSAISKSLRCSICLEPFWNPVRTPCGHVFCKGCLEGWREKKPSCPLDQQPLPASGSFQVDFVLAELLSEYLIHCPNECSWTGIQRDWSTHQPICPNERVSCSNPGCKEVLPRKEVVTHQEICPHLAANKSVITLNVGGRKFQTLRATLMKKGISDENTTFFSKLFQGQTQAYFDNEGNYFIDRNGDIFAYILEWMRTDVLEVPPTISRETLMREIAFYGLRAPSSLQAQTSPETYRFVRFGETKNQVSPTPATTTPTFGGFGFGAATTPAYGSTTTLATATPTTEEKAAEIASILNKQAQEGFHPTEETLSWLVGKLQDVHVREPSMGLFRRDTLL